MTDLCAPTVHLSPPWFHIEKFKSFKGSFLLVLVA
jgi:hypothetical protein